MKKRVSLIAPRLKIPEQVWKRLASLIAACPMEVGGLGTVEVRDGELVVTDVFLLEQEVSSATIVLDPAAVAKFFSSWIKDGKDTSLLRLWWHSHAMHPVGWSHVDLATIDLLSRENFLVSYVGNHRGESLTRLSVQKPLKIAVDDIRLEVIPEIGQKLKDDAAAEVKEKVRKRGWWRRDRADAVTPIVEEPIEAEIDTREFGEIFVKGEKS